jgi:hypothetical protein
VADEMDNKDLKQTLEAWRESASQQAERPEWFWVRQRASIQSRMDGAHRPGLLPGFAWAGIGATAALALALLIPGHLPQTKDPVQPDGPVAQISDHELMLSLEDTMNSGVPDSLAPASTLANEMEQAYQGRGKGKENSK